MPDELIKLGPLTGFLLAVGYCVWPHVAPPLHQAAPTPALPKIDSSLLKPAFGPPSTRDPFRETNHPAELAARPSNGEASQAPLRNVPSLPPEAAVTPRMPSSAFTLGATLVSGDRRAAIIDGRVYRQGEALERPESSTRNEWTVTQIEPGRVVLGRRDRRDPLVLELPDRLAALMVEAGPAPSRATDDRGSRFGLETLADARAALAAAGVHLPVPDLMEQIARQSGGSLPEISKALLRLLVSPPSNRAAPAPALAASGEGSR
ncbi:hypothetical protein [Tautonia rosea]|uniref:hypothetical protein n=1 Tax=Tautonia rosea TaxID=2728037 RepID=UPI00147405CE|nr:hypothetical protein [Tautonia rosea]